MQDKTVAEPTAISNEESVAHFLQSLRSMPENAAQDALRPFLCMPRHVADAIRSERDCQNNTWTGHRHTVGEWLLIMQKCLQDGTRTWVTGHGDDRALLEMIRQVVAVGISAMEQCGAPLREAKRCDPNEAPARSGREAQSPELPKAPAEALLAYALGSRMVTAFKNLSAESGAKAWAPVLRDACHGIDETWRAMHDYAWRTAQALGAKESDVLLAYDKIVTELFEHTRRWLNTAGNYSYVASYGVVANPDASDPPRGFLVLKFRPNDSSVWIEMTVDAYCRIEPGIRI